MYSEIAQEAFVRAHGFFEEMERLNFNVEKTYGIEPKYNKEIIISIVFSAMAVESFINDYAAVCLGDRFFIENIDRLSSLSKLQVISKFLFHKELEKGEDLFGKIKGLFQMRDRFVHNKSSAFDYSVLEKSSSVPPDEDWILTNPGGENKRDYTEAFNGLKTIYLLAEYFDKNDPNIQAFFRLCLYNESDQEMTEEYVKQAAVLLGITKE